MKTTWQKKPENNKKTRNSIKDTTYKNKDRARHNHKNW